MKKMLLGFAGCAALVVAGCSILDAAADGDYVRAATASAELTAATIRAGELQAEYEKKNFELDNQYYLGRGVATAIFKAYPWADVSNAKVADQTRYVNNIGQYILLAGKAPAQFKGYTFGIIVTEDPAAFSTPGGFVYVGTGMAALARNEDELAAAIAHECGHAICLHSLIKYDEGGDARIANAGFAKLAEDAWALGIFEGAFNDIAKGILTNDYSEEMEYEADRVGTDLLAVSGYDPNAMVTLLQTVEKFINTSRNPGKYLAGHPPTDKRIAAVKKHIAAKGYKGSVDAKRTERFLRYFPR